MFWALSPAYEHTILGTLAVFWALSPTYEHTILGTLAVFWALSLAYEHTILGTLAVFGHFRQHLEMAIWVTPYRNLPLLPRCSGTSKLHL